MMHTNLIILAGGTSSRMKNSSSIKGLNKEEIAQANSRSKGLIEIGVNGRPLIDYLLYNAKSAGYKDIYIVVGEQDNLFNEYYGIDDHGNDFYGLNIFFAIQYVPKGRRKPFGTADALFQTIEQYPELIMEDYSVCTSNNLHSVEALSALRVTKFPHAFISYDREAIEVSSKRISKLAIAKLDDDNLLLDIIERPNLEEINSYRDMSGKIRVSMNAFKFSGVNLYKYLKKCPIHPLSKEKELQKAFLNMLRDFPKTAVGIPFSEPVPDITAKEDIVIVKEYLDKYYGKLDWSKIKISNKLKVRNQYKKAFWVG